jgi:Carbohydrate esterase, sialic acid-specific acetylesterase
LAAGNAGYTLAETAPASSGKHLFILSGQSNMRSPVPETFEAAVSKVFGKDNVTVATFSVPSQSICQWYKKWTPPEGVEVQLKGDPYGTLYDKLLGTVRKKAGDQQFTTVTFVWMQGEADGQAGWGAVYEKSFLGIMDQLKADLKRDDIRFVLGRINDHKNPKEGNGRAVVREAQVKLGTQNANGTWVDTDDLNTGINPWCGYENNGEHFPNPGYRVLGQRFARAACKQIDPHIKLEEAIFDARFFHTVNDIAKHAAIGSKITGTTPDDKHAGLSALTDGSYAGNDPDSKNWVAFAPAQKTVELIIDLGALRKINSVAANILINTPAGTGFPVRMDLATSKDGTSYELMPTFRSNGLQLIPRGGFKLPAPEARLVLTELDRTDIRYLKVTFELGDSWFFLDEIIINPEPKS